MANPMRQNETHDTGLNRTVENKNIGPYLEKMSSKAGNEVGSAFGQVADRAQSYLTSSRAYVEKHPVQGALWAAGAGMALGSLLTVAMRSRK